MPTLNISKLVTGTFDYDDELSNFENYCMARDFVLSELGLTEYALELVSEITDGVTTTYEWRINS